MTAIAAELYHFKGKYKGVFLHGSSTVRILICRISGLLSSEVQLKIKWTEFSPITLVGLKSRAFPFRKGKDKG